MSGGYRAGAGRPKGSKDSVPARKKKTKDVPTPDANQSVRERAEWILKNLEADFIARVFEAGDLRVQWEVIKLAKAYAAGLPVSAQEIHVLHGAKNSPEQILIQLAEQREERERRAGALTSEVVEPLALPAATPPTDAPLARVAPG